jgi:hypothetical protein
LLLASAAWRAGVLPESNPRTVSHQHGTRFFG